MSLSLQTPQFLMPLAARLNLVAERVDRLSLRERGLLFAGAIVVVYMAWQAMLMDPLAKRASAVESQLQSAQQKADAALLAGSEADQDPAVLAMTRKRALHERLNVLDAQLAEVAGGYVAPDRMAEVLRALLVKQSGVHLVSLRNLPVENVVLPQASEPAAQTDATRAATDKGPFLHPVEIVLEGDFASVVSYLRELERLPWRLHWRKLDINSLQYPNNRVRIEIGTLSLSQDWMAV